MAPLAPDSCKVAMGQQGARFWQRLLRGLWKAGKTPTYLVRGVAVRWLGWWQRPFFYPLFACVMDIILKNKKSKHT